VLPPIIHTERLTLRPHKVEDLKQLQELLGDVDVMRFSGLDTNQNVKNADEELQWFKHLDAGNTGIRWVITLKEDDRYIGDLGFLEIDPENRRAEVSYKLSQDHWNKGVTTEALKAILSYGLTSLGLNRTTAQVHTENNASRHVLNKLGFTVEGTLREHEYIYGQFADVYTLGLLKREVKL
jgi:ribosomal-protein-alanine N-acetyltransferase